MDLHIPHHSTMQRLEVLVLLLDAIDAALLAWQREAECSMLMPQTIKACERLHALKQHYMSI